MSRLLRRNPLATAGAVLLLLVALVAVLADVLTPYPPGDQVGEVYGAPSGAHLLGLDDGGHDVLSLLIDGTRSTLLITLAATLVAAVVGGFVGLVAGYVGGWVDMVLMRITDYVIVVPTLPLALVVAALWGASLGNLILVIGLLLWTTTARVIRAEVSSIRNRVYVRRIRSVGASHARILAHHILPQVAPLLAATAVLTIALAMFTESALAFLGLGDPNRVTWGTMIRFAFQRTALTDGAWWAIVWPGVAIMLVVVACHWVSQAVEDALNPRLRAAQLSRRTFRVVR